MGDTIDKIVEELRAAKEKELAAVWDKLKNEKVTEKDLFTMYDQETTEIKLKTGTLLDFVLGGGLPAGSSMLLYGAFGSGKTQTCLTMCVECPDHIIYIDTEGSFKASRLKEICDARGKDFNEVFKKIHLFQPTSWIEQVKVLMDLPSPADVDGKIGLIILDSLTKRYRGIEFAGRQTLQAKQPLLREYILDLERLVKEIGAALIITTQIYESPVSNPFLPAWTGERPVGGSSLEHQPDFVVHLRKGQGNIRIARLVDSSFTPLMERPFEISAKGIEDLPEGKKTLELIKKMEKYGKQQPSDGKKESIMPEEEQPSEQ